MTTVEAAPRATSTPVPAGRGRWRLLAYQRQFSTALPIIICELTHARSRRLDLAWNTPAQLSFTVDGHDPEAALLLELATDVVAYRWDEPFGGDRPMFRGLIDHSEDQISEQSATVNFTCHDYFGLLGRRTVTQSTPWVITGSDQDSIVYSLLQLAAGSATSGTGTSFMPGSFLPLQWYVLKVVLFEESGFLVEVLVPWKQAAGIAAGAVGVAALAGLLPALHAVRTRITDALAYE